MGDRGRLEVVGGSLELLAAGSLAVCRRARGERDREADIEEATKGGSQTHPKLLNAYSSHIVTRNWKLHCCAFNKNELLPHHVSTSIQLCAVLYCMFALRGFHFPLESCMR